MNSNSVKIMKRPEFTPYTNEDEINDSCDSLIGIINVRRQELLEQLKERRQQIRNLKICKDRAPLEFSEAEKLFNASKSSPRRPWYYYPTIRLYSHARKKEREAYGHFKVSIKCDKITFRENLKKITDVFLEVTNPDDMCYTKESYEYQITSSGREDFVTRRGQYHYPTGIAYDEITHQLFIADSCNHRIVVCLETGKYLQEFGDDKIFPFPYGVALSQNYLFITDNILPSLLKFSRFDYKLVCKIGKRGSAIGEFNKPCQLTFNEEDGLLYVCDADNNRITVHDTELSHLHSIKHNLLRIPSDIKIVGKNMYVLSGTISILLFKNKQLVSIVIINHLTSAMFFCIDKFHNIIVSDRMAHNIKIFSPAGTLVNTISKEGHERGELFEPNCVCVTNTNDIICVSSNKNNSIQIFNVN